MAGLRICLQLLSGMRQTMLPRLRFVSSACGGSACVCSAYRMSRLFIASSLMTLFVLVMPVFAGDPPTIERVQPPGGQRGSTVDVKLIGKPGEGDLRVLSLSDRIAFQFSDSRDAAQVTIAGDASAGVHWLRFANKDGATELIPFVVGLIPEVSETEPNNRLVEAQAIAMPSATVNGILEKSGDVDSFACTLTSGQTIVAAIQARDVLNSPMDAVLQVVNQRGTVLAQNDDNAGLDPRLAFTAPSDGTWYIRTFAFPAAPDSSIRFSGAATYVYRLTVSTEAVIDQTLPRVRSRSGSERVLEVQGWNLPTKTMTLPSSMTSLESGLALPFDVPIVDLPILLEAQLSSERLLQKPVAVSGVVETREGDSFLVNATPASAIKVRVRAQEFGSALDPVVSILDAAGKVLKEADDLSGSDRDAELQLTVPTEGAFTLRVKDRFRHFGERYVYVLECDDVRPAFEVSVAKTSFVLPADQPLEIPLTIQRRDGFAEPLDFRMEGLPDGVTLEAVRSEKDGESSKAVTLKLTGSKLPASQSSFQIVATAGDSGASQAVIFRVADRSHVSDFWLTIAPE